VQRAQLFFYLGAREERREGEQELLTWELSRKPTTFTHFCVFECVIFSAINCFFLRECYQLLGCSTLALGLENYKFTAGVMLYRGFPIYLIRMAVFLGVFS
jgi:hypothetical protein